MTNPVQLPGDYELVLGSGSPRRQELLRQMGYSFSIRPAEVEENYPAELEGAAIAEYLAELKARALQPGLSPRELLLTSDTVVWCEGRSLAKAQSEAEARQMLEQLSGRQHEVITAVCLATRAHRRLLSDTTAVHFAPLRAEEITYYLQHGEPFDKAGAYGIQEWIGLRAITRIEGSYFTVMGLPTHRLDEAFRSVLNRK